jgi:hypothetical protein
MPDLHVTLLGRFAVTVGGVPVAELVDDVPERAGVLVEDRADAEHAGLPGLADR